jgi:hypothetical protein
VEQVIFGRPIFVDDQLDGATIALGRTAAGRYLFVALLCEDHRGNVFILTSRNMTDSENARNMTDSEKQTYGRHGR